MIKFYIYLLIIGRAKYVGKTIQDPKQRLNQHIALLQDNKHHTDSLQAEWNNHRKYKHKILKSGKTFFKSKIALLEQRAINKYSNCNEVRAIKCSIYSIKEFSFDALDFIFNNWKWIILSLSIMIILERVL